VRFLVDTWGWYALGNARDPQRDQVETFYRELRQVGAMIYTTDYILDETITLLFRRISSFTARPFTQGLLDAIAQGYLRQEEITTDRFKRAWGLRERFHDKPMILFTDLTSFMVMQDLRLSQVVTDDVHFSQIGMGFQILPGRSEKRQ
jgi:predicted nucleic acid-binding protein